MWFKTKQELRDCKKEIQGLKDENKALMIHLIPDENKRMLKIILDKLDDINSTIIDLGDHL